MGESAGRYVQRVARDKAVAGLREVSGPDVVVLGADTEVVLDDEVFGKPADAADAHAMLKRLSGRTHQVISSVCVMSVVREARAVSMSQVSFAPIAASDLSAYVATGESMGKAGAYAIQGQAERFVTHLSGSYSGVMGLPLYETSQLLRAFGVF
jgi:septum formation protein